MTQTSLTIEFLGTGTSVGVPELPCPCEVCHSSDPHDRRLRASAVVTVAGRRLLIDAGPDMRTQLLRSAGGQHIDALLLTHNHYDHTGGIDDVRVYCRNGHRFPVYARADVVQHLRTHLPYCFGPHPYPGAPRFEVHTVAEWQPFTVADIDVLPLPVIHYGSQTILGYRIGPLAYITDAKVVDDSVVEALRGVPLLVINALRQTPHPSHLSLPEAIQLVQRIAPKRALFTHICHQLGFHRQVQATLPHGIELAYDGLCVTL